MSKSKEEYDGEYKIVSDKKNVSFTLNTKWLIGIIISVVGFVGYLLLDEYFIEPMELKDQKIEILEKNQSKNGEILHRLEKNQNILLDRSERNEKIISKWINSSGGVEIDESTQIPLNNGPGSGN